MPDDLQREEELFFKTRALKNILQSTQRTQREKTQEPIVKPQDDTSNILPAIIAAVL